MLPTVHGDLYDYPKYYDLVYGSDWKAEVDFLNECFSRFARGPVRRLFEPACGTGRLMFRLARAGYHVAGLDLNQRAVDFCNKRLQRHGLKPTAFVGDMANFALQRPVDAAFNTINSFRHLSTEAQAKGHLQSVARSLRKGGVYVLGLHLTPTAQPPLDEESWSARRGNLSVLSRLWVIERDRRRRIERVGMSFDVYTPTRQFRIQGESSFRMYTAAQMQRLLAEVPELEVTSVHDFAYDAAKPTKIDGAAEDVIYVLRRK
ncbi:MAG: class I SAM-dependent methyltransferase [Planctomycetota bacterium]|nr:MAG: class I SAM-dependent methyltransferase [Planctomycetota bacterium]